MIVGCSASSTECTDRILEKNVFFFQLNAWFIKKKWKKPKILVHLTLIVTWWKKQKKNVKKETKFFLIFETLADFLKLFEY